MVSTFLQLGQLFPVLMINMMILCAQLFKAVFAGHVLAAFLSSTQNVATETVTTETFDFHVYHSCNYTLFCCVGQ